MQIIKLYAWVIITDMWVGILMTEVFMEDMVDVRGSW